MGKLSICKFGANVKILSDFSSNSELRFGTKLLKELTFQQNGTDFANLLECALEHFANANREHGVAEQMLIIIGDGCGVLAKGVERIKRALTELAELQITVLFLVVDDGKKSIWDTKV